MLARVLCQPSNCRPQQYYLRDIYSLSYFADPEGTELRSEEVAMTGEYMTFVTAGYHFTHCTYMWRQLHRAYAILGYIDEHLDNWNHTLHCQKMLLEGPSWNMADVDTVGRIIYPRCRKIW
jgi:hypothetical protein